MSSLTLEILLKAQDQTRSAFSSSTQSMQTAQKAAQSVTAIMERLEKAQSQAAMASSKVAEAEARAAQAMQRYEKTSQDTSSSQEKIAIASAKASQAMIRVNEADQKVSSSTQRVATLQTELSEAMQRSQQAASEEARSMQHGSQSTSLFERAAEAASNAMTRLQGTSEAASSATAHFHLSIKDGVQGLLDFGNKLGGTINMLQNVGQTALNLGQKLLAPNIQAENARVSFQAFIKDGNLLNTTLKQLSTFAAKTSFQFPDIQNASLKFLNMGVSANQLQNYLTKVGDAVAKVNGDGNMLNDVATILGQMSMKGKVTTEEMQQLTERNIPAFKLLAQSMHVSESALQDMITKGQVGKDKIDLLVKSMGQWGNGAMQAQGKTFAGLWSTVTDSINIALGAMTGPLFDLAKSGLQKLVDILGSKEFDDFSKGVATGVGNALKFIGDSGTYVWNILRSINLTNFKEAWKTVSFEVEYLGHRFSDLMAKLVPLKTDMDPIAELLGNLAHGALDVVTDLLWRASEAFVSIDKATQQGKGPLVEISSIFKAIAPLVSEIGPTISDLASKFGTEFGPSLQKIAGLIGGEFMRELRDAGKFVQEFGRFFSTSVAPALKDAEPGFISLGHVIADDVVPAMFKIRGIVLDVVEKYFTKFGPVVEKIVPPLIKFAGVLGKGLGDALKFLMPYVVSAAQAIGKFAGELIDRLGPAASKIFGDIGTTLKVFGAIWAVIWPGLSQILAGVWDEIVGVVKIAWALVSGIFKIGLDLLAGNWEQAWTDFLDMLSGVWDGIKTYLGGVWKIIGGIFSMEWAAVLAIFAGVGAWFQDRWNEIAQVFAPIGGWFHDRWSEAWSGVTSFFGGIGQWFQDRWSDVTKIWGNVGKWFQDQFKASKDGATNTWGDIGQWFQGRWKDIQNVFGGIGAWFAAKFAEINAPFAGIEAYISGVFQTIYNIIVALVGYAVKWVSTKWNELVLTAHVYWAYLQALVGMYIQQASDKVHGVIDPMLAWLSSKWTELSTNATNAWDGFKQNVANIWNSFVQLVQDKATWIGTTLSNKWSEISTNATNMWNGFRQTIANLWNGAVTFVTDKAKWLGDQLSQKWEGLKTSASGAWKFISDTAGQWWGNMSKMISDKANALKDGILRPFAQARDAIGGVIKQMVNNLVGALNVGISRLESFLNFFGTGLNNIATSLGAKGVVPVLKLGRVPAYASGTSASGHPGGPAITGEKGVELALMGGKVLQLLGVNGPQISNLPRGTSVLPNDKTVQLLSSMGVPGYAGGAGDALNGIMDWIGSGAQTVLDNTLSALHISPPQLPGVVNKLSGSIFSKLKSIAVGWINKILPDFSSDGGQEGGGSFGGPISGSLRNWIMSAITLTHVPGNWLDPLSVIAMHESGGNPLAQNNWDSNAAAGIPSKGLFQTIVPTFLAHALPGHGNIFSPVDNAIAAIRYIQSRYSDVWHVPGIWNLNHGGSYVGYADGGVIREPIAGVGLRTGTNYRFGEEGAEGIYPLSGLGGSGGSITYQFNFGDINIDGSKSASEMADDFIEQVSRKLRRSGVLATWTSGGKA